jgi:hypothetical protein
MRERRRLTRHNQICGGESADDSRNESPWLIWHGFSFVPTIGRPIMIIPEAFRPPKRDAKPALDPFGQPAGERRKQLKRPT